MKQYRHLDDVHTVNTNNMFSNSLSPALPCPPLTVANSDTVNHNGTYTDTHTLTCDVGYETPDSVDVAVATCLGNQTWNVTFSACDSELGL